MNNAVGNNNIPIANVDAFVNAFVNALLQRVVDQLPMAHAAQISARLMRQINDLVCNNMLALAGSLFSATGLAVLLQSLMVVLVNALGFTSGGVLAGSIAAAVQSSIYGAYTGGLFSALQAIGATSVVAPPVVLAIGGACLGLGFGFLGYRLWKKYRGPPGGPPGGDKDDDEDEQSPLLANDQNTVTTRPPSSKFWDLFRRSSR